MSRVRSSLVLGFWPLLMLSMLSLAVALLLFTTHAGRLSLGRIFGPPGATMLIPGVTVEDAPLPAHGLIVTSLRSDSKAASEGIAVGDIVTAIDGRSVSTVTDLASYLRRKSGSTVEIQVVRDNHVRRIMLLRTGGDSHGA